ncbi:MCE family protein [Spirillospora sp. CA-294931]|uniref:MCE family protein n=1 Tax=Spirillospora sp. CA-294931 TaxID=3240042 RepID=UPI003D8E6924
MRRLVRGAALAAAAVTLAGCGGGFTGIQDLPLPGGADLGDDPYTVTAEFANVLDLVPQAAVKVNDVAVGRVSKVTLPLDGWTARVTLRVNRKVKLPANALAHLEQSSLLGEKYVQLSAPPSGATGALGDGTTIPVARTNRNVEVEEVFGALSMLLNGGGLPQLRTITRELNAALTGNEKEIRSVLRRIEEFTGSLDAGKHDITNALDGLNRLSTTLIARKQKINTVLDDLSPGLKILEEQRGALVTMLRQLDELSDVAVNVIDKSKDDMVADFRALAPTLRKLADAGRDLPRSLQVLFTYPFTDEAAKAIKGDYLNVYLAVTAAPGTQIMPPLGEGDPGVRKKTDVKGAPTLPLPPIDGMTVAPPTGSGPAAPPSRAPAPSPTSGSPGGILPDLDGGGG